MTMRTEQLSISRRGFLRTLGFATAAGLIQACSPAAPAPTAPATAKPSGANAALQPTAAQAAPTVAAANPAAQPTTAAVATAVPVSASAPQQAPAAGKPGGTLVAGWDSDPGALDNNVDRGAVTRTLLHMVYDRLVERDISVKADFPPF